MNPVTARLLSQQLICPQFTKPEEVVSWFGAMQGQEYRMVRWAVAMRTSSPSLKAFEKAFNKGRIVRTHLLRCTWQLVAGEDLGWILSVCRTKALSGLRGWMSADKISIPAEEQELISGIFEETLLRQCSARKADFVAALAEKGNHDGRSPPALPHPSGGAFRTSLQRRPAPDEKHLFPCA